MRERLRIRVKKTKRNTIMKHKLPSKVIVLFCVMSMFFLNALGQGKNVTVTVEDIDTYPVGQWRDGYFYFDDSLHGILVSLGRWYNVNVVATNHAMLSQQLHFVAERTMSLDEIIDDLSSLVNDIEICFDGKQISVTGQK